MSCQAAREQTIPCACGTPTRDAELATLVEIVEQYTDAGGNKVELLQVAHESFGSKLAAAIPLGDGPDLFIDAPERIGDNRQRDLLGPADAAITRDADYAANALAAVRSGPNLQRIPA